MSWGRRVAFVTAFALSSLVVTSARADTASPKKLHRLWIGFTFGLTTVLHPSGADVCASSDWVCALGSGPRYPGPGTASIPEVANVGAGFGGLATSQMVASLDVALTDGFLLGLRYGFYFHPNNVNVVDFGTYFNIYEARATWVLGPHPLTVFGFRPYALLGVGLADFSAPVTTSVKASDANGPQQVFAWRVAGPGFVTTGLGLRFGNERFAVMFAPAKIAVAFGSGTAMVFMPEVELMSSLF